MSILCWFLQHNWLWLFDTMASSGVKSVTDPLGQRPSEVGLYQCTRCRDISLGSAGVGRHSRARGSAR